ncbi:hypothetical protein ACE6H2_022821 [Prunus campanulata]
MMYREALGSASCPNCDGPTTIREMSFDKADKPLIIEIAVAAMEELIRMAQMGEPLWMTSLDGNTTVFNEDEYIRTFPCVAPKPNNHFKCEASRESAVVTMNPINLVAILMDVVCVILRCACYWLGFINVLWHVKLFWESSFFKGESAEISTESLAPLFLRLEKKVMLVSGPDIGWMLEKPQDSSRILRNSGWVL